MATRLQDLTREYQEDRDREFLLSMKDFPCSFNLGRVDLNVGSTAYSGRNIDQPHLTKSNCKFLRQTLQDRVGEDMEDVVWMDNLLTVIHFNLDDRSAALATNWNVLESFEQNLVALGNAAFLSHYDNDDDKANGILHQLMKIKETQNFRHLKVMAILEQAYQFWKIGGATLFLNSLALFKFAIPMCPRNERMQFMYGMVYRRCTHFNVYAEDPVNINRHEFARKAARKLFRLGMEATDRVIQSAALIELAYVRHGDEKCFQRSAQGQTASANSDTPLLNKDEWAAIVGDNNCESLIRKALEAAGNNIPEKVLKIAGQLYRNLSSSVKGASVKTTFLKSSKDFLLRAIQIKSTNRSHHQLGLTYKQMAVNFEIKKRRAEGHAAQQRPTTRNTNNDTFTCLPSPAETTKPQNINGFLKVLLRAPRERMPPFCADNPYTKNAVDHFEAAVRDSYNHNTQALYDLAQIYIQLGQVSQAKRTIEALIKSSKHIDPIGNINAYNLYGICFAMEAEQTEDVVKKVDLAKQSEQMLFLANGTASCLAANVPELATAATDLWNAFSLLKTKFTFEGSAESRGKLFKLYELISDYRCLEEIDKILSTDPSVWESVEAMGRCLQSYLNLGDIDGGLRFLDLMSCHPGTVQKFTVHNNEDVQRLYLLAGKRNLSRFLTQTQTESSQIPPDTFLKKIFDATFVKYRNVKTYDVVIVQDVDDDNIPTSETNYISKHLQSILKNICGLNVIILHEEELAGELDLFQKFDIILRSHVALFVEPVLFQTKTLPCVINSSVHHHAVNGTPRIVTMYVGSSTQTDCSSILCGFPKLHLTENDINRLSAAAQGNVCDETVDLIMKIFQSIAIM